MIRLGKALVGSTYGISPERETLSEKVKRDDQARLAAILGRCPFPCCNEAKKESAGDSK